MTDGITLNGLSYVPGALLAVVIAGLDCGNFTVAIDGSIFVPFGTDPDGLMTAAYLNAVNNPLATDNALVPISIVNSSTSETIIVYVPVVIGYPYISQGQVLRPGTEAQVKSPQGPALAKKRRVHNFGVLLANAVGGTAGVTFSTDDNPGHLAKFRTDGGTLLTCDTPFNGVWWNDMDDHDSYDGQITWTVSRPYPCTVVALTGFIETADR